MLLVTTSHSLLLVDPSLRKVIKLQNTDGLYYGIAFGEKAIYVAARKRLVSSGILQNEERGNILVLDSLLGVRSQLTAPFALRDLHHIGYYDNRLWLTCSYDNMIAVWDGKNWAKWYPLGRPVDEPYDVNHFNTIEFFGEEICLVAHNKGPSELHFFSLKTLKPIRTIPLGVQAHNVWKSGNEYFTCSSGEGEIISTSGFVLDVGGFPRGVGFENEKIYIGMSALAEREQRDFTTAEILEYDLDWKFMGKMTFKNEGLLLDIKDISVNKTMWKLLAKKKIVGCV